MESGAGCYERDGLSVPAGDLPVWIDVDFPLLTAEEGRRLLLQVVAEIEPEGGSADRHGQGGSLHERGGSG